jgi:hypothetical protein
MKPYKMVGIALAAFALASIAMAAGPRLMEHGIAIARAQQAVAAPDAPDQQTVLEMTAVATAQEATTLPQ